MSNKDFTKVTEISGELVSQEQINRLTQRYFWAEDFCKDKVVLEVACGVCPALAFLSRKSKRFYAADIDFNILLHANNYYKNKFPILCASGQRTPFPDSSLDIIIIFEALYYLPSVDLFFEECSRLLKKDGLILIATANKDLYDFNPSPHSFEYLGVAELQNRLSQKGFLCSFFGGTPLQSISLKQKILRPLKKFAVHFDLIPNTMAGKRILKRLVFGELSPLPSELTEKERALYTQPSPIDTVESNTSYKVIYCVAKKR